MNIPQLPTDNLYKFMALAGVVLFLFGIAFPLRLASQLQLEIADIEVQAEIAQLRTEQIEQQVELLRKNPTATLPESLNLQSKLYELREQTAILSGQTKKARSLIYQFLFFAIVGLGSALAGYFLARAGFKFWYIRVQRPVDLRESPDGT